jgi:hypothetical protein
MAQVTGTHSRYDLQTKGENVREELANMIDMISPTETPFQSMIGKETSKNTVKSWLTDSLATASTSNAHIDGDAFSGDTLESPARLENHHQILRKDIVVTRRAQTVDQAGTKSELSRQIVKGGMELRRDLEATLLNNQAAVVGSDSVAPKFAGVPAWLTTNTDRGTGGTDGTLSSTTYGYADAAAGDGTVRALTEDALLGVVKDCTVAGGRPDCIMVGPTVKQKLSQYLFGANARIATPYQDHGKAKQAASVVGAVDYYTSDFGTLEIVYNLFQRERDVFVIDKSKWALSHLDKYKTVDMAKTSDADQKMLLTDVTLCSKNEAASGIVADVDETAAVTAS